MVSISCAVVVSDPMIYKGKLAMLTNLLSKEVRSATYHFRIWNKKRQSDESEHEVILTLAFTRLVCGYFAITYILQLLPATCPHPSSSSLPSSQLRMPLHVSHPFMHSPLLQVYWVGLQPENTLDQRYRQKWLRFWRHIWFYKNRQRNINNTVPE